MKQTGISGLMQRMIRMTDELKKKFIGGMIGAAVGDALGAPYEFQGRNQVGRYFNIDSHKNLLYTDDTQLMIALAESIVENGDDFARSFGAKLVKWAEKMSNDANAFMRKPGSACMAGAKKFSEGKSPESCGIEGALGDGAAMRIIPIGLFYDAKEISLNAKRSSELTHRDPRIYTSSSALAYAISKLKNSDRDNFNPFKFLDELVEYSDECESQFGRKEKWNFSDALKDMKNSYPSRAFIGRTENIGRCFDTVPLAIYCFLLHPYDFTKAVSEAVLLGKDTDTSACITGGMSGTFNGIDAIPEKLIQKLEDREKIVNLASALFEKYKSKLLKV